jgi:PKD repeat protein
MIKKTIPLTIIIVSAFFFSCLYSSGEDIPSPPHCFKGYAMNETGDLAATGTIVSAKLNNIFYNTTVKNGTYGFLTETESFYVNGSDGDGVIHFYINGVLTTQTATFVPGGLNVNFARYLNLSLDTAILVINSVAATGITSSQATISWVTNKSANSTVNYGTSLTLGHVIRDVSYVKNHSLTLTTLLADTTYYYEVVSYDHSGHIARDNNSGAYYHFTTEQTQGETGDNDSDAGDTLPPVDTNHHPIAHAAGPYYGLVHQPVTFDASQSNDTDGYIVNYSWNLGDGTIISTIQLQLTYTYSQIGNYTVILTVTDNEGEKNSTTTKAYISTNDTDGDGWSNDAEQAYGTNPNNASDFPEDSDHDGIPDIVDSDNDNDGLSDTEEVRLGLNPFDASDVLRISNEFGVFFLLDTNGDAKVDTYYNQTTGMTTPLITQGTTTFLIDVDGNNQYDYIYNSTTGTIALYQSLGSSPKIDYTLIYVVLIICLVISFVLFLVYKIFSRGRKKL